MHMKIEFHTIFFEAYVLQDIWKTDKQKKKFNKTYQNKQNETEQRFILEVYKILPFVSCVFNSFSDQWTVINF